MSTWGEARYAGKQAGQRHGPRRGDKPASGIYRRDLTERFKRWSTLKVPQSCCYYCNRKGRMTSGLLLDIGTIWKCDNCREEHAATVRNLAVEDRYE